MKDRELILSTAKEQFNFHPDEEFFCLEDILLAAKKNHKYESYLLASATLLYQIALIVDREIK